MNRDNETIFLSVVFPGSRCLYVRLFSRASSFQIRLYRGPFFRRKNPKRVQKHGSFFENPGTGKSPGAESEPYKGSVSREEFQAIIPQNPSREALSREQTGCRLPDRECSWDPVEKPGMDSALRRRNYGKGTYELQLPLLEKYPPARISGRNANTGHFYSVIFLGSRFL